MGPKEQLTRAKNSDAQAPPAEATRSPTDQPINPPTPRRSKTILPSELPTATDWDVGEDNPRKTASSRKKIPALPATPAAARQQPTEESYSSDTSVELDMMRQRSPTPDSHTDQIAPPTKPEAPAPVPADQHATIATAIRRNHRLQDHLRKPQHDAASLSPVGRLIVDQGTAKFSRIATKLSAKITIRHKSITSLEAHATHDIVPIDMYSGLNPIIRLPEHPDETKPIMDRYIKQVTDIQLNAHKAILALRIECQHACADFLAQMKENLLNTCAEDIAHRPEWIELPNEEQEAVADVLLHEIAIVIHKNNAEAARAVATAARGTSKYIAMKVATRNNPNQHPDPSAGPPQPHDPPRQARSQQNDRHQNEARRDQEHRARSTREITRYFPPQTTPRHAPHQDLPPAPRPRQQPDHQPSHRHEWQNSTRRSPSPQQRTGRRDRATADNSREHMQDSNKEPRTQPHRHSRRTHDVSTSTSESESTPPRPHHRRRMSRNRDPGHQDLPQQNIPSQAEVDQPTERREQPTTFPSIPFPVQNLLHPWPHPQYYGPQFHPGIHFPPPQMFPNPGLLAAYQSQQQPAMTPQNQPAHAPALTNTAEQTRQPAQQNHRTSPGGSPHH